MIRIVNKDLCCGCKSCAQTCPQSCISFSEDIEGFSYPKVDENKCINCGLCEKVCPILQDVNISQEKIREDYPAYAAITNNADSLEKSSSGGVFFEFAKSKLKEGWYVAGCIFDENFHVRHVLTNDINIVKNMRGSKYVQSDTSQIFTDVKFCLEKGHKVLFTGTPCQCSAMRHFIRNKSLSANLLLIDFACHGVPSPMAWELYLNSLNLDKITRISMRDKALSWERFCFVVEGEKEGIRKCSKGVLKKNIWMRGFLSHIYNRPSCYDCRFRKGHNSSDITISDCWGVRTLVNDIAEYQCKKGVSSVILRTEKGKDAFDKIKDYFWIRSISYANVLSTNSALVQSHKVSFGTYLFPYLIKLGVSFRCSVWLCCAIGKILRILRISQ